MAAISRVFVASSSDALDVAYAVQENLQRDAELTVWDQDSFPLTGYPLNSLLELLDTFHFGIFVLTPDDDATIRARKTRISRDNVIFELGLFLGRHGIARCFILQEESDGELHLPSDFAGVTVASFRAQRSDDNLRAALGPACNQIRKHIRKVQPRDLARPAVASDAMEDEASGGGEAPPTARRLSAEEPAVAAAPAPDTSTAADAVPRDAVYVAAVCVRPSAGSWELLLARTARGLWTLPKGARMPGESAVRAVERYARLEAGAIGRVEPRPLTAFRYTKGGVGQTLDVAAFVMHVTESTPPTEVFRDPRWVEYERAADLLAEGRSVDFANEARALVRAVHAHLDR